MVRRIALALTTMALSWLLLPAVPALAGGGCHAGVTTGSGDTVEMVDACFTPTTLRVDPGATVTFVNTDPMIHNVTANLWGHFDDLAEGDTFRATFDEPGIYPYACSYHPGMSGAIVVGDGTGAGNGETVAVAEAPAETSPEVSPAAAPDASSDVEVRAASAVGTSNGAVAWLGGGAIGLALGVVGALAWRRRSSAS